MKTIIIGNERQLDAFFHTCMEKWLENIKYCSDLNVIYNDDHFKILVQNCDMHFKKHMAKYIIERNYNTLAYWILENAYPNVSSKWDHMPHDINSLCRRWVEFLNDPSKH